MKKRWWAATAAVALAIGGGALWQTGRLPGLSPAKAANPDKQAQAKPGDPKAKGKDAPPLEFQANELISPALTTVENVVQFSGALLAPDTAVLRSKAAGTLLALNVKEGDHVKAGQLLGRVDVAEATARVTERQALLELARAQHAQAQRTLASNQRLADQQFISGQALDTSRSAEETARAQVQAAKAALDSAQLGLRDANLVAPLSGIVAKRQALAGEKVSLEQPVLTVVSLQRLELAGMVPTHEISRLQTGMVVQVQVEGLAQSVPARITRIAPMAEAGTRSIGVTVELPNAQERLRAGQYAVAQVRLNDETPRLTVPATAVVSAGSEQQVWLLEKEKLVRRTVVLGRRDERNGRVEILQGLSPQSQVLVARFENLRDGAAAKKVASVVPTVRAASVANAAPAASAVAN